MGVITQTAPAYRVPRRYIMVAPEPPPYGLVALSLLGHLVFMAGAVGLSVYLGNRLDQSKVYVVNLVPATPNPAPPSVGPVRPTPSSAPAATEPPAKPAPTRVPERTPPRPVASEPPKETPPPRAETPPPPRETPPPRPEAPPAPRAATPPPRAVEPPPRPADLAPRVAATPRPDLTLPRRAERETPVPEVPGARIDPRAVPPPPAATPRIPDPPRVAVPSAPPVSPPTPSAPALPSATVAGVRSTPAEAARPAGRPDGAPGATPRSITLDVQDFPFTYYIRLIHAKIEERWRRPIGLGKSTERAVVLFEIQPDGELRNLQVKNRSGNEQVDQSALRAVQDASPFPPLPQEFKGTLLRVHMSFESEPDKG